MNWINKLNLDSSFQATLKIQNYTAQFSLNYIYRPTHWDSLEWLNQSEYSFPQDVYVIAFAVVTGAKKVRRLQNLQNFLTGSMQVDATGEKYGLTLHNSSVEHLRCLMEWEQFKIREKEGKQVVNLINN